MEKSIRNKILDLMKKQDISYGELSKRTKLSKSTLQRYITKDDSKVPIDRLKMIANGLNTTPAYLLGWENEEEMIVMHNVYDKELDNLLNNIKERIYDTEKAGDLITILRVCSTIDWDKMKQLAKISETFEDN